MRTPTRSSRRSNSVTTRGSGASRRGRRRCCHGGELRGAASRRAGRDGRPARTPTLPGPDRRPAAVPGIRRREQGAVPRLRGLLPGRRGPVARGGVPRRPRPRAHLGDAARDRCPAPRRGEGEGRTAAHRRDRELEGRREDRKRRGQARRPPRGARGRGARLPPPSTGGTDLGRRAGDDPEAPGARDPDGRARGAAQRGLSLRRARTGGGPVPPRRREQPRPPSGTAEPRAALDGVAVGRAASTRDRRRRARRPRRPRRLSDAIRGTRRTHGRPPAAVRGLHARDPVADAPRRDRVDMDDPRCAGSSSPTRCRRSDRRASPSSASPLRTWTTGAAAGSSSSRSTRRRSGASTRRSTSCASASAATRSRSPSSSTAGARAPRSMSCERQPTSGPHARVCRPPPDAFPDHRPHNRPCTGNRTCRPLRSTRLVVIDEFGAARRLHLGDAPTDHGSRNHDV